MQMSQFHYLPMTPGFFSLLVVVFAVLFLLLQLGALRYAYLSLGVRPATAMWLLIGSLVGSYFNVPVAVLPAKQVMSDQIVNFFGMQYPVPVVENWPGTVIAVNVGGAVIPVVMSLYLLFKHDIWGKGLLATAIVAVVIHWMATPTPGLGIAVPVFNLDKVQGLGAPVASIGGAGTFDGIFLTGILAVLLASLYARPRQA
jgi:uncharacterized membrane protein